MRKFLHVCLAVFMLPLHLFAAPGSGSLEFVENKGQWPEAFRYKMSDGNGNIYLENNVFTYVVGAAENIDQVQGFKTGKYKKVTLNYYAYKMVFENANPQPVIEPQQIQEHYYNFYLGNDPKQWKSGIHPCMEVDYQNLYTNIDLKASSDGSRLTYDFIVKPGANPETIKLRYDGIEELHVKNGNLQIPTSVVTTEEMKPYAYQVVNGQQVQVYCRYKVNGNRVSYDFPDGYDKTKELVIDPTVVFATFTGSNYDNWGYTATYDAAGNFYAGGLVSNYYPSSSGYPVVPATGAIQTSFGGGDFTNGNHYPSDISISKFNATGSALIYSTYLGGSSNEQPHSLVVDPAGDLIIAGRTYSANFPTTTGAYDRSYNGNGDLILTKFNASGTALLGSTYVGGSGTDITNDTADEFGYGNLKHNYGDDARSEVIVDQSGNIYVAASTRSTDFPTTSSAIKTTLIVGDAQDGVVLKMNSSLTTLIWSTYLGGDDNDAAYVLSLDKTEANLYVAGGTQSTNFPFTTGAYISSAPGGTDGFISKFLNGGSYPCLRSTYIGRNGYDQCYGVEVDAVNNVYAMGQTLGGTFPVSTGVYSNPASSQFVIKLDANLSANLKSTVFGSGDPSHTNISPVAFLIDTCGNIYISGWGGDIYTPNYPVPPGTGTTTGMPTGGLAGPAAQSTTDGADFYFIVLSTNMANLLYATYMGSSGGVPEHVDGGTSRFDKNGIVYQAICGACGQGTFPTTAGAYATKNTGPNCNLVALKIAFFLGPVDASFTVQPGTHVCLGTPITVVNTSVNATSYLWDFGDGSPTSNAQTPPAHTYTSVGTYTIRLIGTNPIACNLADTYSIVITVDNNKIDPSFVATVVDTCAPFLTTFKNTSQVIGSLSGTVYYWDFGDGTTYTGQNPPNKNYSKGGTYTIKLVMSDPGACNSPDSFTQTVTFRDDLVKASFDVPSLICLGDSFAPSNTSVLATSYLWNFGDGKTSTDERPFHKFDSVGTYKVTLVAYNPTSCNKVDSASKVITIKPSPFADFSYTPIIPVTNEINRFTNLSQNAVSYNWNFGDGTGTTETSPEHFYKRSGTYDVCLVATNKEGCTDTACKPITADILPLADIPNAFSPNGDGNNDILFVVGAAIETIDLKIYNRWGQLVFESTDIKKGWDGTYNGKRQEVDVYAYTLNVRFVDDTTMFKKGNVTLLR